jgi:hypothetical protein
LSRKNKNFFSASLEAAPAASRKKAALRESPSRAAPGRLKIIGWPIATSPGSGENFAPLADAADGLAPGGTARKFPRDA